MRAKPDDAGVEPSAAIDAIETRAEAVRDEQVARALARLGDDVSPAERRVVARLGERLADRLVAVPTATLADLERDDATARTAVEMFER